MGKQVHNIYLTFISTIINDPETQKKIFQKKLTNFNPNLDILGTNESALEYILKTKWKKNRDFKFEKVYLMCSSGSSEERILDDVRVYIDNKKIEKDDINITAYTSLELFKKQIRSFFLKEGHNPIAFDDSCIETVSCGSDLDNMSNIQDSIIRITELVSKLQATIPSGDQIHLYIDTTGGPRHAAMIFLIIARIMTYLGIEIADIFYTNYVFKTQIVTVHSIRDIYQLTDLVSGFDEFNLFGSVKKLNSYWDKGTLKDEVIKYLFQSMDSFSDAINISSRGTFEAAISELEFSLEDMFNSSKTKSLDDALIKTLYTPIKNTYKELLNRDGNPRLVKNLDYIEWCLEHDYLQQALTLFVEYIPLYMYEAGLVKIDQFVFNAFIESENNKDLYNKDIKKYIDLWYAEHGNCGARFIDFLTTCLIDKVVDDSDLNFNLIEKTKDRQELAFKVFSEMNYWRNQDPIFKEENDIKNIRKRLLEVVSEFVESIENQHKALRTQQLDQEEFKDLFICYIDKQIEVSCKTFESLKPMCGYRIRPSRLSLLLNFIRCIGELYKDINNITHINSLPIDIKNALFDKVFDTDKYRKYLNVDLDKINIEELLRLDRKELRKIRNHVVNTFKNKQFESEYDDFLTRTLFESIDYDAVAHNYLNQEGNKYLYGVKGVILVECSEKDTSKLFEFLRYYYAIKKVRNESNHAKNIDKYKLISASELKAAMEYSMKLLRSIPIKQTTSVKQ